MNELDWRLLEDHEPLERIEIAGVVRGLHRQQIGDNAAVEGQALGGGIAEGERDGQAGENASAAP